MQNDRDGSHQRPGGREGRPHKEYAYSPVSAGDTRTANGSETLEETYFIEGTTGVDNQRPNLRDYRTAEMTEKGSKLLQYLSSGAGNICAAAAGAGMGWSSPILPMLKEVPIRSDNPLGRVITDEEGSWIGSAFALGGAAGGLGAGFIGEKFGRKKAILFSTLPFMIGWILVATAGDVWSLYMARFFFGFATGSLFTVLPMYIGEISEASIRGAMGSLMQAFIGLGLIWAYAIGPYTSYTTLWIACACLPIVFFASFITMPESPYWLLSKERKDDAIKAMARLRGKTAVGVQKEVDEMQVDVEEAYRNQSSYSILFTDKANFKALSFTCVLVTAQQFCGINVILFYAGTIFNSTGSNMDSGLSTIIVGAVMLGASLITPAVVDRLGRKMLLIGSSIGCGITMGTLGLYFYLQNVSQSDVTNISWLPVTSLVVFIACYSLGLGPLPWAVMGELFASDVKSKGSSITVVLCWLIAFCITKFFTNVETAVGTHTAFWIFAVCCALSAIFVFFLLPETKGKTLQQIQDELNGIRPTENGIPSISNTVKQ